MTIRFSLDKIDEAATEFLAKIHANRVIAFHGEMGAGKTTFIQAICRVMGVKGELSSPTFSIINEYQSVDGHAIYHIDLYRLQSEAEAKRAGVEEAFYSNSFCFVEWPERTPGLLPADTLHCRLVTVANNERELTLIA